MSGTYDNKRMTLAEAQEINAAWPRGSIHDAAQAKAVLAAHNDHSVGLPLDAARHGARVGSAFYEWYNSYAAEIPAERRLGMVPELGMPYGVSS